MGGVEKFVVSSICTLNFFRQQYLHVLRLINWKCEGLWRRSGVDPEWQLDTVAHNVTCRIPSLAAVGLWGIEGYVTPPASRASPPSHTYPHHASTLIHSISFGANCPIRRLAAPLKYLPLPTASALPDATVFLSMHRLTFMFNIAAAAGYMPPLPSPIHPHSHTPFILHSHPIHTRSHSIHIPFTSHSHPVHTEFPGVALAPRFRLRFHPHSADGGRRGTCTRSLNT